MEHEPYQDPGTEEEMGEQASAETAASESGASRGTRKLPTIETKFAEVDVTSDERTMAALAHGSIILTLLTGGLAGILVAFVVWAVYREKSRWVADQSLQALIFQVAATITTYILLSIAGAAIALSTALMVILVGFCLLPIALVLGLVALVVPLVATAYGLFGALETYHGRDFQYWWVGKLVRDRGTS